jgi:universal stress protein A
VLTFKNIVCPVDFSACSRNALTAATELAKSSDAALTIVHVWQLPIYGGPETMIPGEAIQEMAKDAERTLADWETTAKTAGIKTVKATMVTGAPWNEIMRLVEATHADLVVMGTHGRTGLKHALIGSVAERVVRHARCAVLVIR